MTKLLATVAALGILFGPGQAQGQGQQLLHAPPESILDRIYRPQPQRWVWLGGATAAEEIADFRLLEGRIFDLAIGPKGLPVLGYIDRNFSTHIKSWDGRRWVETNVELGFGVISAGLRMASSAGGDVAVAIYTSDLGEGRDSLRIFLLDGAGLKSLGEPSGPFGGHESYALAFEGASPVFARRVGDSILVRRWDGTRWEPLGEPLKVAGDTEGVRDPQSPSLAVTADGRIVLAHSSKARGGTAISILVWNGSRWTALDEGILPSSISPSLVGGNSRAPAVAYLNGRYPEYRYWNGARWSDSSEPCKPPRGQRNVGRPSLALSTHRRTGSGRFQLPDQAMLVCGLERMGNEERSLAGRIQLPSGRWEALGIETINGRTALADGTNFSFVLRVNQWGQPWVAWARRSRFKPDIVVSTLAR